MRCRCGYQWTPRTENPKACPECKRRLGMQSIREITETTTKSIASQPAPHEDKDIEIPTDVRPKNYAKPVKGTPEMNAYRCYMRDKNSIPTVEELKDYMENEWE